MTCAACREAVSASMDDEAPGLPQRWVEQHLFGCAACRGWVAQATEATRRVRVSAAPVVPDVTAAVLDRLPRQPQGRWRWADAVLRMVLLTVGAGQLAVSLPAFSAQGAMAAPPHLAHETGAWNLGLAVCFLGVAARPRLAAGALPFLLPFTAVLAWTTVSDLAGGQVHAGRAVAHLLLLGGALLVSALALGNRAPRTGPSRRRLPRAVRSVRSVRSARRRPVPQPGSAPGYAAAAGRAAARGGHSAAA